MKVIFKRKGDSLEDILAVERYKRIWEAHNSEIIDSFTLHSGMQFQHKQLTIYVSGIEGGGDSGDIGVPMQLSYRDDEVMYDDQKILCLLLHELAHRLLISNGIRSVRTDYGYHRNFLAHKRIDIFLYDVWVDIVGEDRAAEEFVFEINGSKAYHDAWLWAINKTYPQRQAEIAKLRKQNESKKLHENLK